jgi:hypothetical protein
MTRRIRIPLLLRNQMVHGFDDNLGDLNTSHNICRFRNRVCSRDLPTNLLMCNKSLWFESSTLLGLFLYDLIKHPTGDTIIFFPLSILRIPSFNSRIKNSFKFLKLFISFFTSFKSILYNLVKPSIIQYMIG